MADKHVDEVTGVETTGHEWDGVRELNNPLPRWWLSLFYICTAWALLYTVFFPAWPMVTQATAGILGYTTRGELAETLAEHEASQAPLRNRIAAAELEAIREDQDLFNFALASGKASFALNCSQCHGSGAAGNEGGFPNLLDDDWIWGGALEDIHTTITHGIRNDDDDDARFADMPRFGVDELLTSEEIAAVAQHVLNFSGRADDKALLEQGATIFEEQCTACHGEDGTGDQFAGGPNLTDAIWLYGGEKADIIAQIIEPQQGVMPAWGLKLDEATVKELAVYVHALGGGQ